MNFKRKGEREYPMKLPLIALIDVVLFLLLYFLIAGTLANPESQLSAALTADRKGGGQGSALTAQVLKVEVAKDGATRYVIGQRAVADRETLVSVLQSLPKPPGIVIKVADEATVAGAATALQAAKDAGFTKVSYVAGN